MNIIEYFKKKIEELGYTFAVGDMRQLNLHINDIDFSASNGGVVVCCNNITEEYYEDRTNAIVALYLCKMMPFDFDSYDTVAEQMNVRDHAHVILQAFKNDNVVDYSNARITYGFNEFADNVLYCCVRMRVVSLAAEYTCFKILTTR